MPAAKADGGTSTRRAAPAGSAAPEPRVVRGRVAGVEAGPPAGRSRPADSRSGTSSSATNRRRSAATSTSRCCRRTISASSSADPRVQLGSWPAPGRVTDRRAGSGGQGRKQPLAPAAVSGGRRRPPARPLPGQVRHAEQADLVDPAEQVDPAVVGPLVQRVGVGRVVVEEAVGVDLGEPVPAGARAAGSQADRDQQPVGRRAAGPSPARRRPRTQQGLGRQHGRAGSAGAPGAGRGRRAARTAGNVGSLSSTTQRAGDHRDLVGRRVAPRQRRVEHAPPAAGHRSGRPAPRVSRTQCSAPTGSPPNRAPGAATHPAGRPPSGTAELARPDEPRVSDGPVGRNEPAVPNPSVAASRSPQAPSSAATSRAAQARELELARRHRICVTGPTRSTQARAPPWAKNACTANGSRPGRAPVRIGRSPRTGRRTPTSW